MPIELSQVDSFLSSVGELLFRIDLEWNWSKLFRLSIYILYVLTLKFVSELWARQNLLPERQIVEQVWRSLSCWVWILGQEVGTWMLQVFPLLNSRTVEYRYWTEYVAHHSRWWGRNQWYDPAPSLLFHTLLLDIEADWDSNLGWCEIWYEKEVDFSELLWM